MVVFLCPASFSASCPLGASMLSCLSALSHICLSHLPWPIMHMSRAQAPPWVCLRLWLSDLLQPLPEGKCCFADSASLLAVLTLILTGS